MSNFWFSYLKKFVQLNKYDLSRIYCCMTKLKQKSKSCWTTYE